jgi:putative peptidoglycan lipid II flippase
LQVPRIRGEAVLRDSMVISGFNALGVVGALLVDVALAAKYGLGTSTDALFLALTIPQLLATVLGTATNPVVVPLLSGTRVESGETECWKLFSNLLNLTTISLTLIAVAGTVCSGALISVSAPGLSSEPRQIAISLSRILFAIVALAGLTEVMKAMLNSYRRFAVPAAAYSVQHVVVFLGIVLVPRTAGIQAIAVSYVVGYSLQVLLLSGALIKLGGRYYPVLQLRHPAVREAGRLFAPLLMSQMVGQSNIWLERFLASFLPPGSVSALVYARRVLRALTLALVNSVSNALLPRFSELASRASLKELRRSVSLGLKLTLGICLPVAAGVMVTSVPLMTLLFRRGAFGAEAVSLAATTLVFYMPGLPLMAMWQTQAAPFYSMRDTKTPVLIITMSLAILAALQLALMRVAGLYGLAMALSLSRAASAIAAYLLLRRKIGEIDGDLWRYTLKAGIAAASMAVLVLYSIRFVGTQTTLSQTVESLVMLVLAGILGSVVYVGTLLVLRVREAAEGIRVLRRKALGSSCS